MTNTVKNESWKEFLKRTLADPVLIYAVIAMMSIMNHYRSSLTVAYGIAAFVAGWLIFRLFDFINKHHIIGTFVYIALFSAFMFAAKYTVEIGSINYPISWGLWFLTPQDVLQYNKWFTLSIFLLFLIFMLSVIYYFTRVRYRLFMNFLILIIPFSIYGKENEEMHIGFIVALCVGFFIVLANFRQMSDTKESVAVDKPEMRRSAAVFTVLFALAASFVPKPTVEADRTMIETLIDADALTDRFLSMLSVFRDDSTGEIFRNNLTNTPLYYAVSPVPLRLKTSTFTYYDYRNDKWKASHEDSFYKKIYELPFNIHYDGGLAEVIEFTAGIDSEYAEKYGFDTVLNEKLVLPDTRKLVIRALNKSGNAAPVPSGASAMTRTTYDDAIGLTKTGIVFSSDEDFDKAEEFTFDFALPSFFSYENNKALTDRIAQVDDYWQFLDDTWDALMYYYYGLGNSDVELKNKVDDYLDIISEDSDVFGSQIDDLLDYGGNEKIYDLAQQLTEGIESPYDKAKMLEYYFIENGYNYDLNYRKEVGENVEDFIFKTKTGVCYEYATAMTLLARAAGIPARYCEGYNMQNQQDGDEKDSYVITTSDAHGFPELYIKGYGWMTFEPTMANGVIENKEKKSAASLLSSVGVMIFLISAFILGLILLYPIIAHKFFMMTLRRKSPDNTVSSVIRRICKLYGIPRTASVHEAESEVCRRSAASIKASAELFDRSVYGEAKLDDNDKTKAIEEYVSAYNALIEARKAERSKKIRRAKK